MAPCTFPNSNNDKEENGDLHTDDHYQYSIWEKVVNQQRKDADGCWDDCGISKFGSTRCVI